MSFYTVYEAMQKRAALNKEAGPVNDLIATQLYGSIPYVGPVANAVGSIAGLVMDSDDKAENDMNRSEGLGWLPGVGAARVTRRLKNQNTAADGSRKRFWSTTLGPLTSTLLAAGVGAAAGAGIGGAVTSDSIGAGALNGAGRGAVIGAGVAGGASLLAALIAACKKRRTKEEQLAAASDNSAVAADYLVPGYATYNAWKSYGRSIGDMQEKLDKA